MTAVIRWFGLDVRQSNAATEDAVSAIEATLDDMIEGFREQHEHR